MFSVVQGTVIYFPILWGIPDIIICRDSLQRSTSVGPIIETLADRFSRRSNAERNQNRGRSAAMPRNMLVPEPVIRGTSQGLGLRI